jgi:hypothetical protein
MRRPRRFSGDASASPWEACRRSASALRALAAPPDPPAGCPVIPDGASAILSVLSSSALVLDASERVVNNSPTAVADGFVAGDRLVHPALLDLSRAVRRDGVIREQELTLHRPQTGSRTSSACARPRFWTRMSSCSSTIAPRRAAWRRCAATSSSTSPTNSRPRSAGCPCSPRRSSDAKGRPGGDRALRLAHAIGGGAAGQAHQGDRRPLRACSRPPFWRPPARPARRCRPEAVEVSQIEAGAKDIAITERSRSRDVSVFGDSRPPRHRRAQSHRQRDRLLPAGDGSRGRGRRSPTRTATVTVTDRGRGIPPG